MKINRYVCILIIVIFLILSIILIIKNSIRVNNSNLENNNENISNINEEVTIKEENSDCVTIVDDNIENKELLIEFLNKIYTSKEELIINILNSYKDKAQKTVLKFVPGEKTISEIDENVISNIYTNSDTSADAISKISNQYGYYEITIDLENEDYIKKLDVYNWKLIKKSDKNKTKITFETEQDVDFIPIICEYNSTIDDIKSKSGIITNIENNTMTIQNVNHTNYFYKIDFDNNSKFINTRTTENIEFSNIKIGDYYDAGKIIRNITGEEQKQECLKNLANCYVEGTLYCYPREITKVENMGNYVIITLIMEDGATEYFKGKDNLDYFELRVIAKADLDIPTSAGDVTIYNLKEETEGFMFWIGLDKETINNKYPTIKYIEIYDK